MKKTIATVFLGLALTTPALALDLVAWGKVGNWDIVVDPNHGNGCAAETKYSDGTYLRLGFVGKKEKAYLDTFSPAWDPYKKHNKFPVTVMMDDDTFTGEAHRQKLNDMHGAKIEFDNPDMLVDIAKKRSLTISSEGTEVVKVGLDGSLEAVEAMIVCQAEQN